MPFTLYEGQNARRNLWDSTITVFRMADLFLDFASPLSTSRSESTAISLPVSQTKGNFYIIPPVLPAKQKQLYKSFDEATLGKRLEIEWTEIIGEYNDGGELFYYARQGDNLAHKVCALLQLRVSVYLTRFHNSSRLSFFLVYTQISSMDIVSPMVANVLVLFRPFLKEEEKLSVIRNHLTHLPSTSIQHLASRQGSPLGRRVFLLPAPPGGR